MVSITVSKVGHLVIRVSDLGRALRFYECVLGLREVARGDFGEGAMVFLSTGNSHHDLALVEVGGALDRGAVLHHFALKVGDSRRDLASARSALEDAGVTVHMALDHRVSQGLYVSDPDGNLIELYVDAPEKLWRDDPSLVANSDPLAL
jgi:catechol 2,3-dioxygenase